MVQRISADRPRLLAAVMEARDYELARDPIRVDLVEFASFVLLCEVCHQSVAADPIRTPFLIMLAALSDKYDHPRILRDIARLARAGVPL